MALVTLTQAKQHLRIPAGDSSSDEDINGKREQASAIVLDYLKSRLIAIESISIANPTVITTAAPHSLTSGVTVPITGTTTTPTINGNQVVTVTGPTTFTVPVNVTVGQEDAAGTVGSPSWTTTTAPGPVQAATLLLLSHLHENRGDDLSADTNVWQAVERLLIRFRDPALA